ncbi:hypothetical protein KFE25_008835 [Diacronema lutheri]|uniref:Uncharacterized protein n=1 Tax=Diacronema lutheri TaxID=2081491 RepID=A0A8J5XTS8_DIALT|nr:hypothetical protein KFE25_008835 [Diacronema lutheri]
MIATLFLLVGTVRGPALRHARGVVRARGVGAQLRSAAEPADGVRADVAALWTTQYGECGTILYGDSNADATTLGVRISQDSTITKLWTRDDWAKHVDVYRFWRHLVFWPRSTVVRSLLPVLAGLSAWTALVFAGGFSLPMPALALSVSPLALLLAFRVNSATARFSEARTQWGRTVLHARDAAAIIATMGAVPLHTRAECCRLLCSFGWAVKSVLRSDDSMRIVLDALLPPPMAAWVGNRRKPPLGILALLRQRTANIDAPTSAAQSLSTCLSDLNACYGGMERIFSTPLSPTYMRHTTRGLLLWLGMLPAGLCGAGVSFVHSLVAVCATGYIMLGIEEIGIQIEQPFDCLPLHGMATVLTMDVLDELCPEEPLPPVGVSE